MAQPKERRFPTAGTDKRLFKPLFRKPPHSTALMPDASPIVLRTNLLPFNGRAKKKRCHSMAALAVTDVLSNVA